MKDLPNPFIEQISEHLDSPLKGLLPNSKFWGLVHKVQQEGVLVPMKLKPDSNAKRVSVDDTYTAVSYHYLNGDILSEHNEEESLGFYDCYDVRVPMVFCLVGRADRLAKHGINDVESLAIKIQKSFFSSKLPCTEEFCHVKIKEGSTNTRKENVLAAEFDGNPFENLNLKMHFIRIEYVLRFHHNVFYVD